MSDQYKTSFNYLLTHKVMPRMFFSNLDFFYDSVITHPKKMALFIRNCVQTSKDLAENNPDIESGSDPVWTAAEEFKMELMGKGVKKGIILVRLPKPDKVCDCLFIAFPCMREKAGYFTCELSSEPLTGETIYITGEWLPEENNFRQNNLGKTGPDMKAFSDMVIKLVYGGKKKINNDKVVITDKTIQSDDQIANKEEEGHYEKIAKLKNTGWAYYRNGELDKALDCFNQILDIEDDGAVYFHCRSVIHKAMGNDYKADYDLFRARLIDMIDAANDINLNYEHEIKAGLDQRKPLIVTEELYDIFQNGDGDLLFTIKQREGEPRMPEIFYSGGKNALFRRRMDQYVLLDDVHEDARDSLGGLNEVLVAEVIYNNEKKDIVNEYAVPVRQLPKIVNLDSIEDIRNDGYLLFASLASLVRANPNKPINEVIAKDDLPGLAAVLAREEEYALLEKCISECLPLNEKLGWWFKDWQPTPLFYITIKKVWPCLRDPVSMLNYLVRNRADPNLASIEGDTPLGNQCHADGLSEIMKALLACGADPNVETVSGGVAFLPLHFVLLPANYDEETHDFTPYSAIDAEKAKLLIDGTSNNVSGADVNAECNEMTPLGLAITYGKGDIRAGLVTLLLNRGANIDNALNCMEHYAKKGSLEFYYALYEFYNGFPGNEITLPAITERKTPELAKFYLAQGAEAGYQPCKGISYE